MCHWDAVNLVHTCMSTFRLWSRYTGHVRSRHNLFRLDHKTWSKLYFKVLSTWSWFDFHSLTSVFFPWASYRTVWNPCAFHWIPVPDLVSDRHFVCVGVCVGWVYVPPICIDTCLDFVGLYIFWITFIFSYISAINFTGSRSELTLRRNWKRSVFSICVSSGLEPEDYIGLYQDCTMYKREHVSVAKSDSCHTGPHAYTRWQTDK